MSNAKYYFYRNLHTGTFSLKYRGRVINHPIVFSIKNASFKVNETGRQRVIAEQKKNVHAFALGNPTDCIHESKQNFAYNYLNARIKNKKYKFVEVTYNPYKSGSFVVKKTGKPITEAKQLVGIDNKLYVSNIALEWK